MIRLILMDLDGTLLRSDKSISPYTLKILKECQKAGMMIGFSTARGESNAKQYIEVAVPDLVISSGGALVKLHSKEIYACTLSERETNVLIETGKRVTNGACEITVDTRNGHYWNYKEDPKQTAPDWGEVIYTDYADFHEEALKVTVQLSDQEKAKVIADSITDCDFVKFSDCDWFKFSKAGATKKNAAERAGKYLGILPEEMIAFGDDYGDMEMLQFSGTGIAMGNAVEAVKKAADGVTDDNDHDGVARYLEAHCLAAWKSEVRLETCDLIIKKAVFEDWKELYRNIWSRGESAKYMQWKLTADEEAARQRMQRTLEWQREHHAYTVYEKKSGQAIGWVGMEEISPGVYEDTGLAIGPDFVKRGYGKQILKAVTEFCFKDLQAVKFTGSCRTGNLASKRLMLSCGFSYHHSESRIDPQNGQKYELEFYELRKE